MKRWKLVLSAVLTAAVLAGCSAQSGSSSSLAQTEESSQSSVQASEPEQSTEQESSSVGYQVDPDYDGSDTPVDFSELSAQDLDGNAVDASLFADYKLTVINVWGTYCSPCLQEMPDLGELAQEYAEKGVQIVGIVGDVMNSDGTLSESQMEKAAQIVDQTGANYVHIPMDLDLYRSDLGENLYAFPTTYFVDSEGKPVGNALVGMIPSKEDWQAYIDAHLAAVEQS